MADEGRQRTDSSRTGEAPAERAAAEEVPELALGEARHPDAVGGSGRLREETLEVRAHDRSPPSTAVRRPRAARRGPANAVPPFGRRRASASRAALTVRANRGRNG